MSRDDDEIERLQAENERMYGDHIISMNDMVIELATRDKEIERLQAEIIRLSKASKRLRKTMASLALRVWKPQSQKGGE